MNVHDRVEILTWQGFPSGSFSLILYHCPVQVIVDSPTSIQNEVEVSGDPSLGGFIRIFIDTYTAISLTKQSTRQKPRLKSFVWMKALRGAYVRVILDLVPIALEDSTRQRSYNVPIAVPYTADRLLIVDHSHLKCLFRKDMVTTECRL